MTISPPKCKTCGVAEWRHVCKLAGKDVLKAAIKRKPEKKPK